MPTRIVLVRHAESVWPRLGVPDDDMRPLTENGLSAAQALRDGLERRNPAAVLSSPQLRAVQTVEPTAQALNLPVITWPELREWESGLLPRKDWLTPYAFSWANPQHVHGIGESLAALTERAGKALSRIAQEHPDATVIVGSHGTFIARALIAAGQEVDWEFCLTMPMPAIYEVTIDGS